jgi:photosystem II stability/assembly factor-like uncharacterized protein
MVAPVEYPWSFIGVAVVDQDRAVLVADHDQSTEDFIPFGAMSRWTTRWENRTFNFFAVDVCVAHDPDRSLLIVGNHGTVIRRGADDSSEEHIDRSTDGPGSFGAIRAVSTIDQHAYAVGMRRQVYRCNGPSEWVRIDEGVRVDLSADASICFNSIAGFNRADIYAAGDNGEIWHYDDQTWSQCTSPTGHRISKVVCAGDGHVYLLGQEGLLVKGRLNDWTVLEQTATGEGFHDACWFKDKLYACTANGLWVLNDGALTAVDIGQHETRRSSCFEHLDANDDCIWSAGAKMLLRSMDGVTWEELPYPEIEAG